MIPREQQTQNRRSRLALAACVLLFASGGLTAETGSDLAPLCADRAAIERVYYNHRTGTKPPFEETLSREDLRRLVESDLAKEAALHKVYGLEVTASMLAAEVQRINSTTRAPDILAELKAALGNDPDRFARTIARPIVIERILRNRFENDDRLHAPQRREAERARTQLLAAKRGASTEPGSSRREEDLLSSDKSQSLLTPAATNGLVAQLAALLRQGHANAVSETTWQLGARPTQPPEAAAPEELEIKQRFGPNAQLLSKPQAPGPERTFHFDDLPGALRNLLRVQLRQPGDVSAVIETPSGFLLYLCTAKTAETLSVATLTLPKRSYEQWLADPAEGPR